MRSRDERRTCLRKLRQRREGAGWVAFAIFAGFSRWPEAATARQSRWLPWGDATLALCTGAGKADSRSRARRGAPDARPARATGPCEIRGCDRHAGWRSEEHTSELQPRQYLVCRLLLEKKKKRKTK